MSNISQMAPVTDLSLDYHLVIRDPYAQILYPSASGLLDASRCVCGGYYKEPPVPYVLEGRVTV